MTPREKIETMRRHLDQGEFPWASELRHLLDVAEAAARHVEDYRDEEGEGCDFGSERCTACALEQALARLGEGE